MFKMKYNAPLNRDSWAEVFINEPMYVANVLHFAICRVQQSDFDNIKEFVITYNEKDFDINFARGFVPTKLGFNMTIKKI